MYSECISLLYCFKNSCILHKSYSYLTCPCLLHLASGTKVEPFRRENARKGSVVNVNPTNIRPQSDSPEIRKYKKKFNSEILCAALWGEFMGLHILYYTFEMFSL